MICLQRKKSEEIENNKNLEIKPDARQILEMETHENSETKIDAPQLEIKTDAQPVVKTNPHRKNPYYKLLLVLLREFVVVDYPLESFSENEPDKKASKTNSYFKQLDEIAQCEVMFIQATNAILAEHPDPVTYYNLKRFFGEEVNFPTLLNIATANYNRIKNDIDIDQPIPEHIAEHINTLVEKLDEFSHSSNIYLEGQKYKLRGSEAFNIISLSQTELYHYLALLVRSTVATDKFSIFDLWKGENKAPIHLAAAFGNPDIIQDLININADFKELGDSAERRPIHYATVFKNFKTLRELIEQEVEINSRSRACLPPIYLATELGYTDVIAILWEADQKAETNQININAIGNYSSTLLFVACTAGKNECVKWLLEHGADVTIPDSSGKLPIHGACLHNRIEVVETILKQFPKQINALDEQKKTPLHYTAKCGFAKLAEVLVNHGAKTVVLSDKMQTPLSLTDELPEKRKLDTQQVLINADRLAVNKEIRARKISTYVKRTTKIFLPATLFLLLLIGSIVFTVYTPQLDLTIRLIIVFGGPALLALGIRQLTKNFCAKPLEIYFLRRAESQANRAENRHEVVNDIENNLKDVEELSTHANIIPSLGKETNIINIEPNHHDVGVEILDLNEEEMLKDSHPPTEQKKSLKQEQSNEESSEEEFPLSRTAKSLGN